MKNHGIIAYGTPEDREKLAAVAKAMGVSGSAWIIEQIRVRYQELFVPETSETGTDPE
jgi:hypothetical protein